MRQSVWLDSDATAGLLAATVGELEVEDHIWAEAEDTILASENPGADNVTEEADSSDTVG